MAAKKVTIAPDMAAPTLVLSSAQAPNAPVANKSPRTLLDVSNGWAAAAVPPPPAALTGPGRNTHMSPRVASASLKKGCLAMPPAKPKGPAGPDELLWAIDSSHRGISCRLALAASPSNLQLQRPPKRIPPPPLISPKQPASLSTNLRGPSSHSTLNRAFNSPGTCDLPLENPPLQLNLWPINCWG
jgi:hypothetical protein